MAIIENSSSLIDKRIVWNHRQDMEQLGFDGDDQCTAGVVVVA